MGKVNYRTLYFEIPPPWMPQGRSPARRAAHRIERRVGPVRFHLVNNLEQPPEFPTRPAPLREPLQVFRRQVVNRDASRRKMVRPKFSKRHVHPCDHRKVRRHVFGKKVFHPAPSFTRPGSRVNALVSSLRTKCKTSAPQRLREKHPPKPSKYHAPRPQPSAGGGACVIVARVSPAGVPLMASTSAGAPSAGALLPPNSGFEPK